MLEAWMRQCSVKDCSGRIYSSGLCSRHYNRLRTTGTTDDGPRSRSWLEVRFWRQVDVRTPKECWPWVAKSRTTGYGVISLGGRDQPKVLAHRLAWVLANGKPPEMAGHHGAVIRHQCNNRLCCNPAHLIVGSQSDNVKDMWANKLGPRGNARLTEAQIDAIRKDKRSSRTLAPVYGVSAGHIRSIRQGRCWK